jgi:hypothetical protein
VVIWIHCQQIQIYGFQEKFEVALSPVGKVYITSTILSNALTGMYGNTTSTFFGVEAVEPPTVQEYLYENH